MNEDLKKAIIQDINSKVGADITNLVNAHDIENELVIRRNHLQSCLTEVSNEVPTKLSSVVKKAERNSEQIKDIKEKSEGLAKKVNVFLNKTEGIRNELSKRYKAIDKLEDVLFYLKTFEKIEDLSDQLKQCGDDEQAVLLYGELKMMCSLYTKGHRAIYVKETTHYWHNILKEKLTRQYESILKVLQWPFTTPKEMPAPSKEVMSKFSNLTKYLFLIEEPKEIKQAVVIGDLGLDQGLCIPVKVLLRPLKKRFTFHFTGSRKTARIDRPEWFLTQTLTWIKDHNAFIRKNVQPVADKLQIMVKAEDEFNAGLITLAAERLHTVLGLYHVQGVKGEMLDVDAAFAHAVDETLGFHRELTTLTGKEADGVLSVLTKAEIFVRWLAVEKKYALTKMEETLSNEQWMEAVAGGAGAAVGAAVWVPRGADWFVSLLKTIEDRYATLPQPGHRLQFVELQLELVEEWRVRLTQLLAAAVDALDAGSFAAADDAPHPLTAVINAAHHTRTVLLQWAHSLHYLQLHYYRRQFQHFTQQHHEDAGDRGDYVPPEHPHVPATRKDFLLIEELDETVSLIEVEVRANKMALNDVTRRDSVLPPEINQLIPVSPLVNQVEFLDPPSGSCGDAEEPGVWDGAPGLMAHLRDAGLTAFSDHVLLEFKAALRDYAKQKWHAMAIVEEMALSVSPSLCRPLSGLCARLHAANAKLAPTLCAKLRAHVASEVDIYVFEEVVMESWWNTGGTAQFNHDVKRNLVPAFAPSSKATVHYLPRLLEACKLLNMDYDDARRLRAALAKKPTGAPDLLMNLSVRHILPQDAVRILSQRTDLSESSPPPSVMELF